MAAEQKHASSKDDYYKAYLAYRLMAEEATDIVILFTPDGRIHTATPALGKVLGRTADEFADDRILSLVHPEDRADFTRFRKLPGRGEVVTGTHRFQHADGHYIWLETELRSVFDGAADKPVFVISATRDVTARKTTEREILAAQQRAETANRAKSRFLANMSHELRTPLNAIIGFTELMRRHTFGPLGCERYEEYATLIYDSGQLLLDLISDMLDMAKIEAGKLELNCEPVDFCGTVEDCVRMLRDRAENGGLELGVSLPKKALIAHADKRAVKQILLNVLTNAIKYTPAGGYVGVSVRSENGYAILAVSDTGIGIPKDELPRLGNPFEPGNSDPMVAKGGVGLGLALVRALVEKHGGRLLIESEEGAGTTVTAAFPISEAKRSAA
jgi:PAS domain S-box-containing protein